MIAEHEFLTARWFWTSYAYRNEAVAEQAWLRLADVGRRQGGKLELGFYRHGSSGSGPVIVTAVSLEKHGIVAAERVLSASAYSGFENEPERVTLEALIARRVRAVSEMHEQGLERGSYETRRQEGVKLRPDGTYE